MWLAESLVAAIQQVPNKMAVSSKSELTFNCLAHLVGGERLTVQNIHKELQLIISENIICLLELTEKILFKGTNELNLHYVGFGNAE